MLPIHRDPHYTFRFGGDRIIPRFHLEGVAIGVRVAVFAYDAIADRRRGFLVAATVGEGGWVELPEPIIVRNGEGFVVVPEGDHT